MLPSRRFFSVFFAIRDIANKTMASHLPDNQCVKKNNSLVLNAVNHVIDII